MFAAYVFHLSYLAGNSILYVIDGKTKLGQGELCRTGNGDGQ